jgi:hypothetical protein
LAVRQAGAKYHKDLELARRIGEEPFWASWRYKAVTGHWPSSRLRNAAPVKTTWSQTPEGKNVLVWA